MGDKKIYILETYCSSLPYLATSTITDFLLKTYEVDKCESLTKNKIKVKVVVCTNHSNPSMNSTILISIPKHLSEPLQ